MALLANEKAYKMNYTGYEGSVTGFLQPYAAPGYLAGIQDARYPEMDGQYLVEATQIHFGLQGGRRTIEVGPKLLSSK